MDETPTIIIITAGIIFLVGGVTLYNQENSYWSDGSKKVSRNAAEQTILNWRTQTRRDFGIKGGRKKYTVKHYK